MLAQLSASGWTRVALGVLLASVIGAPAAAQEASAPATAPLAAERPSALPWLKLQDLSATRERPLFREGRRPPFVAPPAPPSADSADVAQAPLEPPQSVPALKGIIRGGAATLIVLEDQMTSRSVVVRSGESFGPWQVVAETDRRVRLASGDDEVVLDLFAGEDGGGEPEPDLD